MLCGLSGSSGSPVTCGGLTVVTTGVGGVFVDVTAGGGVGLPSVTSTGFCASGLAQPASTPSTARLQNSFFIGYRSLSRVFNQWAPRRFTHIARFRAEPLAHAAIARY